MLENILFLTHAQLFARGDEEKKLDYQKQVLN